MLYVSLLDPLVEDRLICAPEFDEFLTKAALVIIVRSLTPSPPSSLKRIICAEGIPFLPFHMNLYASFLTLAFTIDSIRIPYVQ